MEDIFLSIGAVVVCSAVLAWLASQGRQPIILAYFLCGVLLGPVGLKLIHDVTLFDHISRIGIALLLFLAGMVLHPDRLHKFFKTAVIVTLVGGGAVWVIAFATIAAFGYNARDAGIAGLALMFSSTILVVKLLPTTTLHHKRMGSICIAVLIAQDLLAVIVLMLLGAEGNQSVSRALLVLPVATVLLIAFAVAFEQVILRRMMRAADRYNEVLEMLCLGWCVGVALLAEKIGIPYEVGAFIAGVAMARGKIALVLSEALKPLRDFFLMFFFFVLGATFEFSGIRLAWLPAVVVAALLVILRPILLGRLLLWMGEEKKFASETGIRLGPGSEFGLIIAVSAAHNAQITAQFGQLIQLTIILTMVISSYVVVWRCPTPIGFRPGLKRD